MNRVFGGLNLPTHSLPPAGQPAFLAGNPIVVQQRDAAVLANRSYGFANSNQPAFAEPLQIVVFRRNGAADSWATQGSYGAVNASGAPLRPLTRAEFNWLFGDLNGAMPNLAPSGTSAYPPIP
jgi:hypothetical protein